MATKETYQGTDRTKGSGRYEEVYIQRGEDVPWNVDSPSDELIELVEKRTQRGSALDVGCGTGTEAIFLAQKGFKVSGIDIAPTAVNIAMKKAQEAGVKADFRVGDVLTLPYQDNQFVLINDRGCFHTLNPTDRKRYIAELERVLRKGGIYFMMCFSEKQLDAAKGAYRFSEEEIRNVFSESHLSIISINPILMKARDGTRQAYCCTMNK